MNMTYPFDFTDYLDEFDDGPLVDSIRHIYDQNSRSFPDEIPVDFDELTDHNRCLAVLWQIDDVLSIRPDLTEEQAWEVLRAVRGNHDANIGVNWDVLHFHVADLFPEVTGGRP